MNFKLHYIRHTSSKQYYIIVAITKARVRIGMLQEERHLFQYSLYLHYLHDNRHLSFYPNFVRAFFFLLPSGCLVARRWAMGWELDHGTRGKRVIPWDFPTTRTGDLVVNSVRACQV